MHTSLGTHVAAFTSVFRIERALMFEHRDRQRAASRTPMQNLAPRCEDGWRAKVARRVLIVDDNVDAADSLRLILELRGHQVRATYDGFSALETLGDFAADVVLLDIGMPRLNGLEVARRIRTMSLRTTPRLIALTGWGQLEDKQRSREAGFDEHLTKPVDAAALARLIEA